MNGKAEDVVHLVRVVTAPGGHDHIRPCRQCVRVADLGIGVGQREDDRPLGHRLDHLLGHGPGDGDSDERIRAHEGILESSGIRIDGEFPLDVVEVVASVVDHTDRVDHQDVLRAHAELDEEPRRSDAGGSRPGEDHLHTGDVPPCQFESVEEGRPTDDGGPVLVVVEHGDVEPITQGLLDLEALRRFDVLEIDAADGWGQHLAESDHVFRLGGVDLQVEHVDVGEALEQHAFALHHRLAGQWTDVAQSRAPQSRWTPQRPGFPCW